MFPNIENTVLENNIFGVDLNEESVEIAKLSLWLRTAQPRRKLNDLNSNIKCGNSLIDSIAVAGDKAFKWDDEFPDIFEKGGFDVVIGNPPYGMDQTKTNKNFYKQTYVLLEGRDELFELFIEKSIKLFKNSGTMSFIIPNTLLSNLYSKKLRQHIVENLNLLEITNFGMDVFNDPTVHTCIISINKGEKGFTNIRKQVENQNELGEEFNYQLDQNTFLNSDNATFDIFFNPEEMNFIQKLEKNTQLKDICFIRQCIKTGDDKIYVKKSDIPLTQPWKPVLRGKGMNRYVTIENDLYLKYGDWLARNWKNKTFYETEKIVIRETGKRITATLDLKNHYLLSSLYSIYPKEEFKTSYLKSLLAIINSELASFYIRKIAYELTKGAFTKVRTNQLGRLPIVKLNSDNENFLSNLVDVISKLNNDRYLIAKKFELYLVATFTIERTNKLKNWYELDFGDFIKELNKAIKKVSGEKLTKTDEMDWMDVFETKKAEAQTLKAQIDKTDSEIDAMVYELYGLSEEEIEIVENG